MKSLVLSALMCAAAVGSNHEANASRLEKIGIHHGSKVVYNQTRLEAFKDAIAFHQRNVDVLWEQYTLTAARIRESSGSHAELDRDKAFFTSVYQQDIEKGVRIAESKKIIADLEAGYAKKHAQRKIQEKKQVDRLQEQLRAALKKEQEGFKKSKKKYADLVNEETLPLLLAAEQHFDSAIARANHFSTADTAMAAR